MPDTCHIALLRGINVGGNNIIKMTDLKTGFEEMGFNDIATYIQSGNVLFKTKSTDKASLIRKIEKGLSERFGYQSRIVLITQPQLKKIVTAAPEGFGTDPDQYRYDVLFLKEPLTADEAIQSINLREGVDQAYKGNGVLYFSRLISKAGQSYLNKLITLPVYKEMTIRNWNTTTKLLALAEK